MYNSKNIGSKSTFNAVFYDDSKNEYNVSIFPPKMSVLRDFSRLNTESADSFDKMIEIIAKIVSKNQENIKFSADEIADIFDFDDVNNFINDFFDWLKESKKK